MNWFEKTYYAGVGINLFDIKGEYEKIKSFGQHIVLGNVNFSNSCICFGE